MARITTTLVAVLILSNSAITVMSATGLDDDIGVELAPGVSDRADSIVSEMKSGFQPGTSIVRSIVSLAISVGNLFLLLVEGTYALPSMLINLGFPDKVVLAFFAPAYMISTLEMALLVLGRRSV
jgi:hypothetical protein